MSSIELFFWFDLIYSYVLKKKNIEPKSGDVVPIFLHISLLNFPIIDLSFMKFDFREIQIQMQLNLHSLN